MQFLKTIAEKKHTLPELYIYIYIYIICDLNDRKYSGGLLAPFASKSDSKNNSKIYSESNSKSDSKTDQTSFKNLCFEGVQHMSDIIAVPERDDGQMSNLDELINHPSRGHGEG